MKLERWLVGVLALGLYGCATPEVYTLDSSPEYMTAKATSFFLHGPQQFALPEELPPETFVRLMRKESGYSVVQIDDGRSGYVATEDLRPAPPAGRAVDRGELFPERREIIEPMPEPDLAMPVAEVPADGPGKRP